MISVNELKKDVNTNHVLDNGNNENLSEGESLEKAEYFEFKATQEKELNEFKGIFFAFDNKQFTEGMKSVGLTDNDTDKIYKLGGGSYILKERNQAFKDMFDRHREEMAEAKKDPDFLLSALIYELCNHEYCITWDSSDALRTLDLKREDIPDSIYKEAIKEASIEY